MQTTTYHFLTPHALVQTKFTDIATSVLPMLIQVFLCDELEPWITVFQQVMRKTFPKAVITGMTSSGQLQETLITRQGICLVITTFDTTELSQCFIKHGANHQEIEIQLRQLLQPDTKAVLLYSADWQDSHGQILDQLNQIRPDIVVAGSVASPQGSQKISSVFNTSLASNDGYFVTMLHGKQLNAQSVVKQNWFPVGKALRVTKSSGYRVFSIDNASITAVYQRYFGSLVANQLTTIASLFPLTFYDRHHQKTALMLQSYKDGSALFNRQIIEDEQVWLSFANMDSLLDNSYLGDYAYLPAGNAFIYSCAGRLELLKDSIKDEIYPISQMLPTAGCFCFGEIGQNNDGHNCLLSHSMSILFLAENDAYCQFELKPKPLEFSNNLEISTSELLKFHTQLSKTLMDDLQQTNELLKQLSVTDTLTRLFNRAMLDKTLEIEYQNFQRNGTSFVVLLLDIDHFKSINDHYGHLIGDEVLKKISQQLAKLTRPNDVLGRWGGEEFLLICPNTTINEAEVIAERLRKAVQDVTISAQLLAIKVTISIGGAEIQANHDIDEVLTLADRQLYTAKDSGRNCIQMHRIQC